MLAKVARHVTDPKSTFGVPIPDPVDGRRLHGGTSLVPLRMLLPNPLGIEAGMKVDGVKQVLCDWRIRLLRGTLSKTLYCAVQIADRLQRGPKVIHCLDKFRT